MIIKRKYITLYHVTKLENLPNIKREGLNLKYFKPRPTNKIIGLGNTRIIYLIKDKTKLVKPLRTGKDCIIELKIPYSIYEKYKKIEGDPLYTYLSKQKDPLREYAKLLKIENPEKYLNVPIEDIMEYIMKESTPFEHGSPENTVCVEENIPPEFINKIYYKL